MIFVHPLYDNFLTTFSHTHIIFLLSLPFFLSIVLDQLRREKMKVVIIVVTNGCTYITTHHSHGRATLVSDFFSSILFKGNLTILYQGL